MKDSFTDTGILAYSRHQGKASLIILALLVAAALTGVWLLPLSAESSITEISTPEQLKAFRDSVNSGDNYAGKTVRLTADIDLGGSETNQWAPIGTDDTMPFSGVFDGNEHKITGLYISTDKDCQGFFGALSGDKAEVKNLSVSGTICTSGDYVGGVVGMNNNGAVSNCTSVGSISGNNVGGVVGKNYGSVSSCAADCSVSGTDSVGGIAGVNTVNGTVKNCTSTGSVSGEKWVGGVVGQNYKGNVNNCTSSCRATGSKEYTGGVVGQNNGGVVSSCVSTGSVGGNEQVGGVVGKNSFSGSVSSCISIGSVSGNISVGGIVGENDNSSVVSNCGWLWTEYIDEGVGSCDITKVTDIVSFGIASKDNVAVACLASPLSLTVTKGGTGTVSLDLAPYATANFLKHVSVTALNMDKPIATAYSAEKTVTVKGVNYGMGKLTISAMLRPTYFNGSLKETSTDVPISLDVMVIVSGDAPSTGGSSGGCSSGFGALALLAAAPFVLSARKRRK